MNVFERLTLRLLELLDHLAHLAQSYVLNLADAFAGDIELLSDFFEGSF